MKRYGERFYTESFLKSKLTSFSKSQNILKESELIKGKSVQDKYDVFLSHSSVDKGLVISFKEVLTDMGFTVYIDWIDDSDTGRDEITPYLKRAMKNSNVLIFLHTHNSKKSIWTPWEIGYFDNHKGTKYIGVVPLLDSNSYIYSYSGQEYLKQYTEIGTTTLSYFIKYGID